MNLNREEYLTLMNQIEALNKINLVLGNILVTSRSLVHSAYVGGLLCFSVGICEVVMEDCFPCYVDGCLVPKPSFKE